MKRLYPALLALSGVSVCQASDLVITGVIDGPLSGGTPKAIELFVINDIPDLSVCGIGSANNGGGSDGQEFTFPPVSITAGQYLYVASEVPQFTSFFGFAPSYTSGAASINGDDAIELFCNEQVVDVFGDINTDGSGQPWEYLDGWAYRNTGTGPDANNFVIDNWIFSGSNALDGQSSNAAASTPFPLGAFVQGTVGGGDTGGGNNGGDTGGGSPGTGAACFNCPPLAPIADASLFNDADYYAAVLTEVNAGAAPDVIKQRISQTIANDQKVLTYSEVWTALTHTDEDPANTNNVLLWYSGRSIAKSKNGSGVQSSDPDNWNREHSWPQSHGFKDVEGAEAFTDLHHLRATDISVNQARGNLDFDNSDAPLTEAPQNRIDSDSFEPRDVIKGDVARMMFYMDTRYQGVGSDVTTDLVLVDRLTQINTPELGRLCRLMEWHLADPVDQAESLRNDTIYAFQGNRNPFIDHPEWASLLYSNQACSTSAGGGADGGSDNGGGADSGASPELILTGVIDGPLSGGVPKAAEIYVASDIADLSQCGLGTANNGGGSDGQEFTFPAVSASAGEFIYVASETNGFTNFFGFAPDHTSSAMGINGDDALELFCQGQVIDTFGDINTDGSGQAWEYLDGWASRVPGSSADGASFALDNWIFSGANALDGESANQTANLPFPVAAYQLDETLLISGVFDGPLTGGTPKLIEFYAATDIADLSVFGFGSANNGGGSDGQEFSFSGTASAGDYLYVATEAEGVNRFFGIAPTFITDAAAVNGDDAIELYKDGQVVDVFGDINLDGSGQAWEYTDGWAYRVNGSGPDASNFVIQNWIFSAPDALDGETSNATASAPFPLSSFVAAEGGNDNAADIGQCDAEVSLISAIQGSGAESPLRGQTVNVQAVVTNVMTPVGAFFVQQAQGDGDPATSEGIYVDYSAGALPQVNDVVRLRGTVAENFGRTTLNVAEPLVACGQTSPVLATTIRLPATSETEFEAYEGMLVALSQPLTVSSNFGLGSFGEVTLSSGRLFKSTHLFAPGSVEERALEAANRLNRILVDDDTDGSYNATVVFPNKAIGGLAANNTLRLGDTTDYVIGTMDFGFGNYRIRVAQEPQFVPTNPRETSPDLNRGNLTLASFNVLNYFTSLNPDFASRGPRGANTEVEFERQAAKIVAALAEINADIVGVIEVENNGYGADSAIADLVNRLNAELGADTYRFVSLGEPRGTDMISSGILYKPAVVAPEGEAKVLTSANSAQEDGVALYVDRGNRPSIAQKFSLLENGESIVFNVNHLRSKGSRCGEGDDDTTTGQGRCNLTRTRAARAVHLWLAQEFANERIIIVGDLNAYAQEDPLVELKNAGFSDVAAQFEGEFSYSFNFASESGSLDHALANAAALDKIIDAGVWHINSDEPLALDYNTDFNRSGTQKPEAVLNKYYAEDPFRASDHDPVLISLNLHAASVRGDWDADGDVDLLDIKGFLHALFRRQEIDLAFDLNQDGLVNFRDIFSMYKLCTRSGCRI